MKPRLLIATLTAATVLLFAPNPAFAHVEVEADQPAVQGGYATLTFTIPNERPAAATKSVKIQFPQDTPIAYAVPAPIDGWTATVTTRTLATPITVGDVSVADVADVVTWDATGTGITGDQKVGFSMLAGPFPLTVDSISFGAVQTYETGEIVRWIEPPRADGSEPEFPAPILALTAGTGVIQAPPVEIVQSIPTTTTTVPATSTTAAAIATTTTSPATPAAPVATMATAPASTDPSVIAAEAPTTTLIGGSSGSGSSVAPFALIGAAALAGVAWVIWRRRRQ